MSSPATPLAVSPSRYVSIQPHISLHDDFLSLEECEHFKQLALDEIKASTVVDTDTGESVLFDHRTSYGMFFTRSQDTIVAAVEARIAALVNITIEQTEPFQILRYGPGQEYRPHYDYFDPALKGSATHLNRGGQRIATLIMYLNHVDKGGETSFPNMGIRIIPKPGRAVLFYNTALNGQPDPRTLHAGDPVIDGEKWIATCWMRQGEFV
jgi:prolyl 4-hydroxylase